MKARHTLPIGIIVLAGFGWFFFRPDRLFLDKAVSETLPSVRPDSARPFEVSHPIASGRFHSVAHETRGTATVYELADGRRVLRFSDFETSNGPDVQVYLVAVPDSSDSDTVRKAEFVHVAALKGNIGDQNYDLPAGVDLGKYRSVTVWCRRFAVNFGTAPLADAQRAGLDPAAGKTRAED